MDKTVDGNEAPGPATVSGDLPPDAPLAWLNLGWRDFVRNAGASVGFGLIVVVAGYLIFGLTLDRPYLFLGAASGFFLLAPLLAAGLYEISRRDALGDPASFLGAISGLRPRVQSLADFGLVLVFAMICWQMLSALLFAFQSKSSIGSMGSFGDNLFQAESAGFILGYIAVGGVVAAFVFMVSAISVPMIVDRNVDVVTAMMTSFRAVRANPAAMFVWAALLVTLTLIGFLTLMAGLAIIVPWLGHASWHAYKALVK